MCGKCEQGSLIHHSLLGAARKIGGRVASLEEDRAGNRFLDR